MAASSNNGFWLKYGVLKNVHKSPETDSSSARIQQDDAVILLPVGVLEQNSEDGANRAPEFLAIFFDW